jgi:hypothetical protein
VVKAHPGFLWWETKGEEIMAYCKLIVDALGRLVPEVRVRGKVLEMPRRIWV